MTLALLHSCVLGLAVATSTGAVPSAGVHGPTPIQLTPKVVTIDGVEGVFLPTVQMQRVEERLDKLQKTEDLVAAQDLVISTSERQERAQLRLSNDNASLAVQEKARADELDKLATEQAQKLKDADSLSHSPVVWTIVGALTTGIIIYLVRGVAVGAN